MITREFNLYLHAGHSIPLVINANQYDRGETWVFTLFNSDGTQYVPSSGAIVGIKSDNLGIINSGTVDASGRVVINETQQMTAAVGKAVFELVIDDGTHGTANFVVLVEAKPGDNADLSESDISMIEEAIEAAANIKPYGSPLVASTVAGMTDETKVYVYTGSETGYTSGHWYYYDGSDWADGGVYNSVAVQTDTTLAISGMAADAKKTGDEISDLKSQINQGSGLTEVIKLALMDVVNHVAWIGDNPTGQNYIDALQSALYPPANLTSITATYTQGGTVYDTDSLEDLRDGLVVTAHYDDSSTAVVTTYFLSGTLTQGTSIVTVSYGGKTTTFNVTVTHYTVPPLYSWDFTTSLTDSIQGAVANTDATLTEGSGISLSADNQYIDLGAVYAKNRTYEFTVTALNRSDNTNYRRIFAVYKTASGVASYARGFFYAPTKGGLAFYIGSWSSALSEATIDNCDGKFAVYVDSTGKLEAYRNGVYLGTSSSTLTGSNYTNVYIGGDTSDKTRVKVTSYKIYEGKVID